MNTKKYNSWLNKKILLGLFAIGICAGGLSYYFFTKQQAEILDFNDFRDTQFILDSFKRDWHWLVEGFDFSPENMLKNRASKPNRKNDITIKVAYEGQTPVGFVIYYKKNFYLGHLWFIDVVPEYRSKGWAYKLFDYAIKDLIKQGSTKINLLTRTSNYPAQKLYTRYGFHETSRDDGFVYYEYVVPEA